jgi:hypothetical protein
MVNVRLWEIGEYRNHDALYPALIDPDWINGQLALTTVSIGENRSKVWATVDLAKVCTLHTISNERSDILFTVIVFYGEFFLRVPGNEVFLRVPFEMMSPRAS